MENIEELVIYTVHNYLRGLLGDLVYLVLSFLLLSLGLIIFLGAVINSNVLLGNPAKRDKSQLGEIEYRKTRTILRFVLGIVGLILFVYNVMGLSL